jgi:UDP-galactopyranose mutase
MQNKKKKILIIGGGIAGASSARALSEVKNANITLAEKNNYLGAGIKTFYYGGHPYTFGPRLYVSKNRKVYNYFKKFVPMRSVNKLEFITYVEKDNQFYNYPINMKDISKMPDKKKILFEIKINAKKKKNFTNLEDYWISAVGKTLYSKVIEKYNKKMWMVDDNKTIDTFSWSPKGPSIKKGNRAVYNNQICSYPSNEDGYNKFFNDIEKIKNVKILLNTEVKVINLKRKIFSINNKKLEFDIIVNTISPDFLFNYKYGELRFLGRDIHKIVLPIANVLPKNIAFVYYANDEKFTRITEFKKFTKKNSKTTLITLEYPSNNGKHYPLPFKKDILLAHKYLRSLPDWYFSIGRAGTYRYEVDIDDSLEQSLKIKEIIEKKLDYPGAMPIQSWWNI